MKMYRCGLDQMQNHDLFLKIRLFLKQVYFKNYPYFSNQAFFNF